MKNIEKSTQVLREEHRLIESATLAFADIIKELERDTALGRRRVWEIVQSFKTYVGRWHHAKEDFLLSMVRASRRLLCRVSRPHFLRGAPAHPAAPRQPRKNSP